MRVGVFIYQGMELQDFAGPTDVFVKANRYADSEYEIITFSLRKDVVKTERNAVTITPDYSIDTLPQVDVVLIPGAPMDVIRKVSTDVSIQQFLKQRKAEGVIIASVCTGAFILSESGLLENLKYTTHFLRADILESELMNAEMVRDVRFVDSGQILTALGITSGIDLALYLIERFNGVKIRESVAKAMQYDYRIVQKWPVME